MALSLSKKKVLPPIITTYGPGGIGKTTMSSFADKPVMIPTENGIGNLDIASFPLVTSYAEAMKYLGELATEDHEYKTAVIDSLDWLEPLIWQQVAAENGKKSIEEISYGKGYVMALDLWREYLDAITYLRSEKEMTIIQIAHAQIKRFENPETESYDRYEIKLHKAASALILEHSDIVLFANHYVAVSKESKQFGSEGRKRAIDTQERILYTEERPSAVAKNRFGLPKEIPFDKEGQYWNVLAQHIPFYSNAQNNNEED